MVVSDHLSSANVELDCEKGTLAIREEFRPYGETSYSSYELKRYRFTRKVPIATGAAKLQQLEKTRKSDAFILNAFTEMSLNSNLDYDGYRKELIKEYGDE